MNILRAKWESAEAQAKELYDKGASIFTCDHILDEARRFFYLMREAEEKEKKAKSEEISWDKWGDLMDKAEYTCIYEGNFEAVCSILDAANVVKNEIHIKEEATRVVAEEAAKRAAEKAEKKKAWLEEISWDKFNELMDKAGEMWEYEGYTEEITNILKAAHVMGDKLKAADKKTKEEKAAKIAKEEATKTTFEETGRSIGCLVNEKNKAYGNSFGKSGEIIRILYPNGIKPDQYSNMLTLIRIIDKVFRLATDNDSFREDAWQDIAGYAILKTNELENKET